MSINLRVISNFVPLWTFEVHCSEFHQKSELYSLNLLSWKQVLSHLNYIHSVSSDAREPDGLVVGALASQLVDPGSTPVADYLYLKSSNKDETGRGVWAKE